MKNFKAGRAHVLPNDVIEATPTVATHHADGTETMSLTSFIVKLIPEAVITSSALDPCGACEECWTNGMPQYCTNPIRVTAYYYREVGSDSRIYGDTEKGFYLEVKKKK